MKKVVRLALLLGIVLFALAGCKNTYTPPVQDGYGLVNVTVGLPESAGIPDSRTIAPDIGIFTKYVLSFEGPAVAYPPPPAPQEITGTSTSVQLIPGEWTITVTAYVGDVAAAIGSAVVNVFKDGTHPVNILLAPIENIEDGIFSYSITIPGGTSVATLNITLGGVNVDGFPINLVAGLNEDDVDLAPGQYLVFVTLTKNQKNAGGTDALHIYSEQTSELVLVYDDDAFEDPVTLGYDLSDSLTVPVRYAPVTDFLIDRAQFTGTVVWQTAAGAPAGDFFDADTVYRAVITIEAKPGFTFVGVGYDAFEYDDVTLVISPLGVLTVTFPATEEEDLGSLNISLGFNYGAVTVGGSDGVNILFWEDDPNELVLTISGYTDVSWYVDGNSIPVGTGNTVTLDATSYNVGPHSVSFVGYRDGNLYGQAVPFYVMISPIIRNTTDLSQLILEVKQELKGIVPADAGTGISSSLFWAPTPFVETVNEKIAEAEEIINLLGGFGRSLLPIDVGAVSKAFMALNASIEIVNDWKLPGGTINHYFRADPGLGQQFVPAARSTNVWSRRSSPADNRIPSNSGTFEVIPYPFADGDAGTGDLLRINYVHNGTNTFGGMSLSTALTPSVTLAAGNQLQFTLYYTRDAAGKYMRFETWAGTGTANRTQSYIRTDNLRDIYHLNPEWIGSYNGQTWFKQEFNVNIGQTGSVSSFHFELHGETSRPAESGILMLGDISVRRLDTSQAPLPMQTNNQSQSVVTPIRSKYNTENGLFPVGGITGTMSGIRTRHLSIFTGENNLKPGSIHNTGPSWLRSINNTALGSTNGNGLNEYSFPTSTYQSIRDATGDYLSHGHVMAWYNQSPSWMTRIQPATLPRGYTGDTNFYGLGNSVTESNLRTTSVEMARRVQYNHIMYTMRHFITSSTKYGSSASRGPIPFHSWDILNEEIHESRHSDIIPVNPNEWKTALKHTNWLVAMSDNLVNGEDVAEHYIYLLFKYAHMAAPNEQMIQKIEDNWDNPAVIPDWMKTDGHLDDLRDITFASTLPLFVYNDYSTNVYSKARVTYNMAKELNTRWLTDPLYDGRNLIQVMGLQGHDTLSPTLASDNQRTVAMYASLIDEGLLDLVGFSELDIKLSTAAPGGGALAPAQLNVRQSDALGYQYALLYHMFAKFAPYFSHVVHWGVQGAGWGDSYLLFDNSGNANAGYYGMMDPVKWVTGHSYLDEYFTGSDGIREWDKVQFGYEIDLCPGLGVYVH